MLETNTAACDGFLGISDFFAAGLWVQVDWAPKMVTMNLPTTLLYVCGQGDYCDPFISPPNNQASLRQWTAGSVNYYPTIVSPELFGKSCKSKTVDLDGNGGGNLIPGDVVYEDGATTRVLPINFVDDGVNY